MRQPEIVFLLQPGVRQASIHNWAKNGSTVSMLAGFVARGHIKPTVQQYFPLDDIQRAVNMSRQGAVEGKLSIVVSAGSIHPRVDPVSS